MQQDVTIKIEVSFEDAKKLYNYLRRNREDCCWAMSSTAI